MSQDGDYIAMDDGEEDYVAVDPIPVFRSAKGIGGRFGHVESLGSSKRSRDTVDNDWVVTDLVLGGPVDGTMIPSFLGHVASRMWSGQLRSQLREHTRGTFCVTLIDWYKVARLEVNALIRGSRLSHLPSTMDAHIDIALICAFVERWQPDMSSFHMPFGEMRIMLHDVWVILRIPSDGRLVCADIAGEQLQTIVMELFRVTRDELLATHSRGGGVFGNSIVSLCSVGWMSDSEAIRWMFLMFGSTLFIDKSGDQI